MARSKTNLSCKITRSEKYPGLYRIKVSGWVRGTRITGRDMGPNRPDDGTTEFNFGLNYPSHDIVHQSLRVSRLGGGDVTDRQESTVRAFAQTALAERYAADGF